MIPLETTKLKMIHSSKDNDDWFTESENNTHHTTLIRMQLFAWIMITAGFKMGWLLWKEIPISVHH